MSRYLILISLLSISLKTFSQITVKSAIDSSKIILGEQAHIFVNVITTNNNKVLFPKYDDLSPISRGIEVIKEGPIDTIKISEEGKYELKRMYTITSFDSSTYSIVPYVLLNDDTIKSENNIVLKVKDIEVDTLNYQKIKPAYGPIDVPFQGILDYVYLFGLVFLFLSISIFLFKKILLFRSSLKKRVKSIIKSSHEEALQKLLYLEELHSQLDEKSYYMQLMQIVKGYIEKRYKIIVQDLTTSQLINVLQSYYRGSFLSDLIDFFIMSDLVKFAKLETNKKEQEAALSLVRSFIYDTINPNEKTEIMLETAVVSQHYTSKKIFKILIWVGFILSLGICLGLFLYLIQDIVQLFIFL